MIQLEPEFPETIYPHYEFRGGRWWECVQHGCDGVHHYYISRGSVL